MQLTLLLPGLLLPKTIHHDTVFDLEAPTLSLILGRGQRHVTPSDWLADAFDVPAPLPAAALRQFAVNGRAEGTWLCLDPVHWQVTREGILLADPADLQLTSEEAAALMTAIAPLLAPWGNLVASRPDHWELELAHSLLLETRTLPLCIGRPVDPMHPTGLDGTQWRQRLVEIQTVLHAHPVNFARSAAGKPVINSLWPWGQGSLPAQATRAFAQVWSNDPVTVGLCARADLPCLSVPDTWQHADGNILCELDILAHPARQWHALHLRLALLTLETQWLAPALAAMKRGSCEALRLVGTSVFDTEPTTTFSLVRGNLWRFWRSSQPLTRLA